MKPLRIRTKKFQKNCSEKKQNKTKQKISFFLFFFLFLFLFLFLMHKVQQQTQSAPSSLVFPCTCFFVHLFASIALLCSGSLSLARADSFVLLCPRLFVFAFFSSPSLPILPLSHHSFVRLLLRFQLVWCAVHSCSCVYSSDPCAIVGAGSSVGGNQLDVDVKAKRKIFSSSRKHI